jgi:L-ascorbate metabolism protein UlaG (beta-lactamase superfamily)
MNAEELVGRLRWLGHDSFRLDGPPVIYFDPRNLGPAPPTADVVLVSHEHGDHCSPDDVRKVSGPSTVVIANVGAAAKLPDHLSLAGIEVETVPAYNVNKFRSPGVPFHPREAQHVGYVVGVEGVQLYFAGDTDVVPEMKYIACDVALLPVSGIYVMTAEEAVQAANTLRPRIVVPMHYGAEIGTPEDGRRFAELYEGRTVVLKPE